MNNNFVELSNNELELCNGGGGALALIVFGLIATGVGCGLGWLFGYFCG